MRSKVALLLVVAVGCTTATTDPSTSATSNPATTTSTAATTTSTSVAPTTTLPALEADIVFWNGTIITMDPEGRVVTGLALLGNRIVAAGDGDELVSRAPDALHVDLGGRTVIPGIIDTHIHEEQNQTPLLENMLPVEEMLLESGRTTLGVPAINRFNLEGYDALRDSGRAILRNHLYLSITDSCNELSETEDWWRDFTFDRSADQRIAIAGIKIFTDGGGCNVPALSFEWIDGTLGDLYIEATEMADILRAADEEGALTVVHAIGDRAVTTALDAFELALGGDNPNRHRIDHNTLVPQDQVGRYGEVGANFVGWGWFNSCLELTGNGWDSLGEDHLPWLRNHREVMEANPDISVAWHSDAPFSPIDIFEQWLALTTFISLDEDGAPCEPPDWIAGNEVSIETALRMMTIYAAEVMDLDSDLGSLEVGKVADLTILANNPLEQVGLELLDNRVDSTWIDGKAGWCDGWDACPLVPGIDRGG